MFENVAHHLQLQAIQQRTNATQEADGFGRSAFNRYYYAAFIRTRQMFVTLDPAWDSLSHSNYPELLKGQIQKRFKQEQRRAAKFGDQDLISACSKATSFCYELAEMFSKSYAIRVIADYKPEEPIKFIDAEGFSLQGVKISSAHEWPAKANTICIFIEKTWKSFNV